GYGEAVGHGPPRPGARRAAARVPPASAHRAAASAAPGPAQAAPGAPDADGPAYGPATLAGNARVTDAQRARAEGRSPVIEPGMQRVRAERRSAGQQQPQQGGERRRSGARHVRAARAADRAPGAHGGRLVPAERDVAGPP